MPEFLKLKSVNEARPIFFKSNLIFKLSSADGLMKIQTDETGKTTGSEVDALIL